MTRVYAGLAALVLLALLCAAPRAFADFQTGMEAAERGDYAAAIRQWQPLAEAGDAAAQFGMAYLYDEGLGVAEDNPLAIKWYRRAAMQGDVLSLYNLGIMYRNGEGVAADDVRAYRFMWLAAELGDPDAVERLRELENLIGPEQIATAKQFATRWGLVAGADLGAIASSDLDAGYDAYERGDYSGAFRLWRPLAEAGNAEAQYNIGYMYDYGEGLPVDDQQAIYWFTAAAEQGHMTAQFNLGAMYATGEGVAADDMEAIYWYSLAAEQGHSTAQYNLAVMYDEGWGVALDDAAAIYWYTQAANQGDVDAQHNLGVMNEIGEGTPADPAAAAYWYRQAAEQGKAASQFNLGLLYTDGKGVPQDYGEAIYWYSLAAEQGDPIAQYNLGYKYRNGLGVPADINESIAWFEAAGQQGDIDALYNLAVIYANGEGVSPDAVLGYVFFSLAAQQGDTEARGWANDMAGDLSPAQIARANEMILDWEAGIALSSAPASVEPQAVDKGSEITATGTGFIVTSSGYTLTNHHVIEGCLQIRIKRHGQPSEPSTLAVDNPRDDLALLKMESGSDAVAVFRSGSTVRPGDDVVVIGYPLHGLLSSEVKITTGTISAASGMGDDPREFQITAPVQPGNSGGPLLDRSAHIVGVIVAKLDALAVAEEIMDIPQNVNFAIKGRVATDFLDVNGIAYASTPSITEMRAADVADSARDFTVLIECWE